MQPISDATAHEQMKTTANMGHMLDHAHLGSPQVLVNREFF